MIYRTFSMFATISNNLHSARKRMLTNVYSKSFLQESPYLRLISNAMIYDRLLPIVDQLALSETTCNILDLNQAFSMDFVSSYLFGLENGTDYLNDESTRESIFQAYFSRKPFDVFVQEIPNLTAWAEFFNVPLIPKWLNDANNAIDQWNSCLCERAEQHLESSSLRHEPLVYKRLRDGMTKNKEPSLAHEQSIKREISSELLDHLSAGFETSAVALTYAIWELSKRSHLQQQLREELVSLSPNILYPAVESRPLLPTPKAIDSLSLLDAVVMETLRLHAPVPGGQPRVVPSATVLAEKYLVPANTRISAQAYSLHRNHDVFPDAECWLPDRWTKPTSSAELTRMRRWFWAFGSGGRMCVGSNFALQGTFRVN
jgi:unspecific monooxygenase